MAESGAMMLGEPQEAVDDDDDDDGDGEPASGSAPSAAEPAPTRLQEMAEAETLAAEANAVRGARRPKPSEAVKRAQPVQVLSDLPGDLTALRLHHMSPQFMAAMAEPAIASPGVAEAAAAAVSQYSSPPAGLVVDEEGVERLFVDARSLKKRKIAANFRVMPIPNSNSPTAKRLTQRGVETTPVRGVPGSAAQARRAARHVDAALQASRSATLPANAPYSPGSPLMRRSPARSIAGKSREAYAMSPLRFRPASVVDHKDAGGASQRSSFGNDEPGTPTGPGTRPTTFGRSGLGTGGAGLPGARGSDTFASSWSRAEGAGWGTAPAGTGTGDGRLGDTGGDAGATGHANGGGSSGGAGRFGPGASWGRAPTSLNFPKVSHGHSTVDDAAVADMMADWLTGNWLLGMGDGGRNVEYQSISTFVRVKLAEIETLSGNAKGSVKAAAMQAKMSSPSFHGTPQSGLMLGAGNPLSGHSGGGAGSRTPSRLRLAANFVLLDILLQRLGPGPAEALYPIRSDLMAAVFTRRSLLSSKLDWNRYEWAAAEPMSGALDARQRLRELLSLRPHFEATELTHRRLTEAAEEQAARTQRKLERTVAQERRMAEWRHGALHLKQRVFHAWRRDVEVSRLHAKIIALEMELASRPSRDEVDAEEQHREDMEYLRLVLRAWQRCAHKAHMQRVTARADALASSHDDMAQAVAVEEEAHRRTRRRLRDEAEAHERTKAELRMLQERSSGVRQLLGAAGDALAATSVLALQSMHRALGDTHRQPSADTLTRALLPGDLDPEYGKISYEYDGDGSGSGRAPSQRELEDEARELAEEPADAEAMIKRLQTVEVAGDTDDDEDGGGGGNGGKERRSSRRGSSDAAHGGTKSGQQRNLHSKPSSKGLRRVTSRLGRRGRGRRKSKGRVHAMTLEASLAALRSSAEGRAADFREKKRSRYMDTMIDEEAREALKPRRQRRKRRFSVHEPEVSGGAGAELNVPRDPLWMDRYRAMAEGDPLAMPAAIIQGMYRMRVATARVQLLRENRAATRLQKLQRGRNGRRRAAGMRRHKASTTIQKHWRGRCGRIQFGFVVAENELPRLEQSRRRAFAVQLQRVVRGGAARRRVYAMRCERSAAHLQRLWRGRRGRLAGHARRARARLNEIREAYGKDKHAALSSRATLEKWQSMRRSQHRLEALRTLSEMPADVALLRWANFHLSRAVVNEVPYGRRLGNFGHDLADGETLAALLNTVAPCKLARRACAAPDPYHRVELCIKACQHMNPAAFAFARAELVAAGDERIGAALLARLFATHSTLAPRVVEIVDTSSPQATELALRSRKSGHTSLSDRMSSMVRRCEMHFGLLSGVLIALGGDADALMTRVYAFRNEGPRPEDMPGGERAVGRGLAGCGHGGIDLEARDAYPGMPRPGGGIDLHRLKREVKEAAMVSATPMKDLLLRFTEFSAAMSDAAKMIDHVHCVATESHALWHDMNQRVNELSWRMFEDKLFARKPKVVNEREVGEMAEYTILPVAKYKDVWDRYCRNNADAMMQINEIQAVLRKYKVLLAKVFQYYCASGSGDHVSTMTSEDYWTFLRDVGLASKGHGDRKSARLDLIFQKCNVKIGLPDEARGNPDKEFIARQFVEALIRVSLLLHEDVSPQPRLYKMLENLLEHYVVPGAIQSNTEQYRERLGEQDVLEVFRAHRVPLQRVFRAYSSDVVGKVHIMVYEDFLTMLREAQILDTNITPKFVRYIFGHTQVEEEFADDVGAGGGEDAMVYAEFLEGVASVALSKVTSPYVTIPRRIDRFIREFLLPKARGGVVKQRRTRGTRRTSTVSASDDRLAIAGLSPVAGGAGGAGASSGAEDSVPLDVRSRRERSVVTDTIVEEVEEPAPDTSSRRERGRSRSRARSGSRTPARSVASDGGRSATKPSAEEGKEAQQKIRPPPPAKTTQEAPATPPQDTADAEAEAEAEAAAAAAAAAEAMDAPIAEPTILDSKIGEATGRRSSRTRAAGDMSEVTQDATAVLRAGRAWKKRTQLRRRSNVSTASGSEAVPAPPPPALTQDTGQWYASEADETKWTG